MFVAVNVAPVIPGLTDHEIPSIIAAAVRAGVRSAGYVPLRLPFAVAPLFEMAKVCANHLAMKGFATYDGSVVSTKLKVTGIDLFSAGDFTGGEGFEEILLSDPVGGVYAEPAFRSIGWRGRCAAGGRTLYSLARGELPRAVPLMP